jgi:hypothetical protein
LDNLLSPFPAIKLKPEIIVSDVDACNGIVQVVDEVLLPEGFYHEYVADYLF